MPSRIKGTNWQENKPGDGIRKPDETTIAGILVKRLEAGTGKVVGTALSDADGLYELYAQEGNYLIEYVFPADGFILTIKRNGSNDQLNSAANPSRLTDKFKVENATTLDTFGLGLVPKANTVTHCTAKAPTVTVWTQDLILPKSDVSATPLSVKLFLNESVWHPTIGIENLGTAEAYDIIASGQVSLSLTNAESFTASSSIPKKGALPGFDGVKDFDGTSGISWYNEFAYVSSTYDYAVFLLEDTFVGDQQISIPAESKSYVGIIGSGNQQTLVQTYVSAGVCAVYSYGEGVLLVKLVSFNVEKKGMTTYLSWQTTDVVNSERFEIERSRDGKLWELLGVVSAKGESQALVSYAFTDGSPLNGENLYRLKMIDRDHTYAYSRINQLTFNAETSLVLYPNPVADQLFIKSASGNITCVQIFNRSGQLVQERHAVTQPIDVRTLDAGVYVVGVHYSNGLFNQKNMVIAQ